MNTRINKAIKELYEVVKEESLEEDVAFEMFINCEGYTHSFQVRTPDQLESAGISMRNIKGDWVK